MFLLSVLRSVTSLLSNNIFPEEGLTRPDTIFNIVVFPQPDGPRIAYLFPFSQVMENGFSA